MSDGIVSIASEVLAFLGGTIDPNVIIREDTSSRVFEDGSNKPVYQTRYAVFGSSGQSYPWESFVRLDSLQYMRGQIQEKAAQEAVINLTERIGVLERVNAVFTARGGMVLWNRPAGEIPQGWSEVTDWRGRLPMGWDPNGGTGFNEVRETGGLEKGQAKLDVPHLPPHSHNLNDFVTMWVGGHEYRANGGGRYSVSTKTTSATGGGQPFSVLNPYRIVVFIEYVG